MQTQVECCMKPLSVIVHDDLQESLKRIKQINFMPDHIAIQLISEEVAVRGTIMILGVVINGVNAGYPFLWMIDEMSKEYKTGGIDYDDKTQTILIPITGATVLTFSNGKEQSSFSKPKSDR